MRILAIETSGSSGTIAAADGSRLLAEHQLDPHVRSARSLAPGIRDLLTIVDWNPSDIELIAVTIGPGSFTGLRVGVATAKTLAYSLGARCVGITTLEVIAAQYEGGATRLSVAIDAQRGQVFAAEFDRSEAVWRLRGEPCVLNNEDWVKRFSRDVAASGPALGKLASQLPTDVAIAAPQRWNPRAATVAALAWERHLQGMYDDVWRLAPLYLRKSAAEEKWEQRQR